MKYNTAIEVEKKAAMSYFMGLINRKALVEVKKISPVRSLQQNNYLHLIIAAFGNHFGYTKEEAKLVYKRMSLGIYAYEKHGIPFLRSSADLTVDEMRATIDNFREESAAAGFPLPLATDQGWLREIENEIERSKYNQR